MTIIKEQNLLLLCLDILKMKISQTPNTLIKTKEHWLNSVMRMKQAEDCNIYIWMKMMNLMNLILHLKINREGEKVNNNCSRGILLRIDRKRNGLSYCQKETCLVEDVKWMLVMWKKMKMSRDNNLREECYLIVDYHWNKEWSSIN